MHRLCVRVALARAGRGGKKKERVESREYSSQNSNTHRADGGGRLYIAPKKLYSRSSERDASVVGYENATEG